MSGHRAVAVRRNASVSCDAADCTKTVVADSWHHDVTGARRKAQLLGWTRSLRWVEAQQRSVRIDLCPKHERRGDNSANGDA